MHQGKYDKAMIIFDLDHHDQEAKSVIVLEGIGDSAPG